MISYADFEKVDIRVGTIIAADVFPEAKKPAYKLVVDFGGDLGSKSSSVQITKHYITSELIGKQVLCVVNFPARRIGPFMSDVLTLGLPDVDGNVVLVVPDKKVPNAGKMF
jgi:tRNA-binding protein